MANNYDTEKTLEGEEIGNTGLLESTEAVTGNPNFDLPPEVLKLLEARNVKLGVSQEEGGEDEQGERDIEF